MIKCKNKVLLCKRREDIPNTALPNYWSVPCWICRRRRRNQSSSAIRETLEETQIELDVASVRFLSAYPAHGDRGVFYDYICEIEEETRTYYR